MRTLPDTSQRPAARYRGPVGGRPLEPGATASAGLLRLGPAVGLALAALAIMAAGVAARPVPPLPRLVFASRHAPTGKAAGLIPGLGPRGRTLTPGGKLMVREPAGQLHELIPACSLWDVSDPCVSWDGRRVVFAGTPAPDSAWRIYAVGADGRDLTQLTRSDRVLDLARMGAAAQRFERYDDFDPIWLPDGRVCFASTRYPQIAEGADVPVSNLFVIDGPAATPQRITSERNGGEEPAVDPSSGRIVYARWWFNRFLPADRTGGGFTTERAAAYPAESVNLWQAVSISPAGEGLRLAAGDPVTRAGEMAYQPAVTARGAVIGVCAGDSSFLGAGESPALQLLRGVGPALPLPIEGARLAACAPCVLPDGRILFSCDRTGSGDFGLFVMDGSGRHMERALDLPGTLELDAAVLAPRPRPPILAGGLKSAANAAPPERIEDLLSGARTFRFDCLNVFANAPVDSPIPDAPPLARGARIRFYAALARPEAAGGDTAVLVRETPLDPGGAVHQHDLPADVPMFEQIVDADGRVLFGAHGPAHVPGFNYSRAGASIQCVGCHAGHSTQTVAANYARASWFNAAPSASVSASSEAPGTAGARALVDRRTRGPAGRVDWIAASSGDEAARLSWRWPIEFSAVVLYAPRHDAAARTDLMIAGAELTFSLAGREVGRRAVQSTLSPSGTRVDCEGLTADAVEVRPIGVSGRILGKRAAALAEVETLARLAPP